MRNGIIVVIELVLGVLVRIIGMWFSRHREFQARLRRRKAGRHPPLEERIAALRALGN